MRRRPPCPNLASRWRADRARATSRLDSDGDVRVDGTEGHALFYRLAQADFNGDGYQDWLLRMDWGAQQGSLMSAQRLVVTRRSAGGPLRLLERI